MLYDTLMGMMGLTAVHYDSACNLFSPDFDKDVTTLMTMYGNVMIRNDKEQVGEIRKKSTGCGIEKNGGGRRSGTYEF